MIKFNDVTVNYGDYVVINNANFTIKKGKITCVIGDSGAGKTTLLNVLSNITKITNGSIENMPKTASYAFQEHSLILNKTVYENLVLFTGENDKQKVQNCLQKVNLLDKIDAYVCTLSGGEKQRVNLVRAMLKNSDILLLDEPFNALDLSLKFSVAKALKSHVKSNNLTTVIVTHDLSLLEFLADEVLVINNGKVIILDSENSTFSDKISKIYK
ncbi:MAG: ABC transporter ATP-binding protein [Clostridia bacterium]|nr:ABC transporter ATP-binding protein [Clostridia bacterium]